MHRISHLAVVGLMFTASCMPERTTQPATAPRPAAALASTTTSAATPLLIIDGITIGHVSSDSLHARLDAVGGANAIDNVEVVKGPAAAAMYGADAQQGVIIITTKAAAKKR